MSAHPAGWLDTNIIVRYLVADDAALADKATAIIEHSDRLLLNAAVLAECSYVLTSVYGLTRTVVIDTLGELIRRKNISVAGIKKTYALDALLRCRNSGRVNIVDALLWAEARSSTFKLIYTFDGRFPHEDVELLGLD